MECKTSNYLSCYPESVDQTFWRFYQAYFLTNKIVVSSDNTSFSRSMVRIMKNTFNLPKISICTFEVLVASS